MTDAIYTRRMRAGDALFVLESWRDSYRMSHTAGPVPMSMYREVYDELLKRLLERPDVEVFVAFEPDELPPDDLYGFICIERDGWTRVKVREHGRWIDKDVKLEQPIVHYVNVKQSFRGNGVARALFAAAGVDPERPWTHTFSTALVSKIRRKHIDGRERRIWAATFDPRLSRFPKHELPKHEPTEE
jgi:GNAT superfamily N-acetyltransferase